MGLSNGTSLLAMQCPCKKSSGVAISVSLQECGFFSSYNRAQDIQFHKPHVKIRFAFFNANSANYVSLGIA